MNQHIRRAFTGPGAGARIACGALLVATVATQHPNPLFNRLQLKDHFSVLPNWKFFAPNPAMHDYHYAIRTLSESGETSEWTSLEMIATRTPTHAFWFATRRAEKAIFDICSEVLRGLDKGHDHLRSMPAFRILTAFLRDKIRTGLGDDPNPKGFQLALLRAAGYETSEKPEILFVSPYVPMTDSEESDLLPYSQQVLTEGR